ncbi:protein TolR [Iodidimonas muriae]|uniref:Protein TolR n=1 Tax=Iodidimonas muriae TaxID=261467 RepID=A0ABQ2LCH4_9PROT|nr:protein TolR [Iodidimonas muriae]GER06733.1 protein TolR [Kordiimonadales bacterium JCM 17843]GGO10207.1 protein TolR [Iodidimonas muriae]
MAGMQIQLRGRDRRGVAQYKPLAEINVTPFVDVMLVLLIVFMVTAPLLQVGVPVDLPRADAQKLQQDNTPLTISVDQTGAIFIEDTEIGYEELVPRLAAIAETRDRTETRIYVRGDRNLDYGRIMQVMSAINGAGFTKVALVADRPQ